MYSHGSSARAGVGKRGHGGRNYRPPRPRRDPNTTPPPLKECSCLLQFHIAEYAAPAPRRDHNCLGGREALQVLEGQIRSQCLCHLVVPGRKQSGPVAIVGRTIQEALPAAAWLLNRLRLPSEEEEGLYIRGQIQRNVKDTRDVAIIGRWCLLSGENQAEEDVPVGPRWLFQSPQWNAMVCSIRFDDDTNDDVTNGINTTSSGQAEEGNSDEQSNNTSSPPMPTPPLLSTLKSCVENVLFRLGNLQSLYMFVHEYPPMALAVGKPDQAALLFDEIGQLMSAAS